MMVLLLCRAFLAWLLNNTAGAASRTTCTCSHPCRGHVVWVSDTPALHCQHCLPEKILLCVFSTASLISTINQPTWRSQQRLTGVDDLGGPKQTPIDVQPALRSSGEQGCGDYGCICIIRGNNTSRFTRCQPCMSRAGRPPPPKLSPQQSSVRQTSMRWLPVLQPKACCLMVGEQLCCFCPCKSSRSAVLTLAQLCPCR
jgi:hypothetical protein